MDQRENRERESYTGPRNPVAVIEGGRRWTDSGIIRLMKGGDTGLVQRCPFGSDSERSKRMGVFQKNGAWWIDFYHQGKRIRRKVGPSKKMAEVALADVQVKKAKNDFLGVCEPRKISFRDFAAEYLEYSKANKARTSYERDVTTVQRHLVPVLGDFQLSRITSKMIEDYKMKRLESVAPATLNREMNTIKSLFSKAVEWEYLRDSPAKPVKWLKTSRGSMRFLSREEADLFLEVSQECQNRSFHAIVLVALHTGMRRGEILRLQWQDVDFRRGKINVVSREGAHTKNYDSRSVPMSRTVMDVLKRHSRHLHSPYVFCNTKGEPFKEVDTSFANALKKSGIPHFRFHDLRHTFASWLVMKGVDIRTVQELLGHKDLRMTMRYAHLAPDHMRKAVEILDAPTGYKPPEMGDILDSHYLDTGGVQNEKQDAGRQA